MQPHARIHRAQKCYFHKAGSALIINAPAGYLTLPGDVSYDTKPEKKGIYDLVQVVAILVDGAESKACQQIADVRNRTDYVLFAGICQWGIIIIS